MMIRGAGKPLFFVDNPINSIITEQYQTYD